MAAQPEKIGRYEILEVAGQGAMGVVYKARDPLIGRTVAVKIMSAAISLRPDELEEYRKRFFREAQAAGKLQHENIVGIFDLGEEGGAPFMVQEFLEGRSLSSRLKDKGPLPLGEAVSILRQVASGLSYAHEQGIVHRDIKPDNILLDVRGRAVITDFGVARFSASDLTRTGEVLGTPHFMSPEQVLGETVDGRSDLFSLGVIFYLMLSGQRPFIGDTISSICYHIVHSPPKPLPENPAFPPQVVSILERLLAKSKDARFATGADLIAALDELYGQTAALPGTGSYGRTGSMTGTRPLGGVTGGISFGSLAGAPGASGTGRGTAVLPQAAASPRGPGILLLALGALGILAVVAALGFAIVMIHGYRTEAQRLREQQNGDVNAPANALTEHGIVVAMRQAGEGKSQQPSGAAAPVSERPQETSKDASTTADTPTLPGKTAGSSSPVQPGAGAGLPGSGAASPASSPTSEAALPQEGKASKGEKGHIGIIAEGWMPQAEFFVFVNGERKIHSVAEGGRASGARGGFRLVEHLVLPPGDYNLRIALRASQPTLFGAEETVHYRLEKGQNLILKVEPKRFPNRLRVIQIPDKAGTAGN